MAELYVKPGNRDRGWNDPPQFSYGLQQLQAPRGGGSKRGPLTRRAALPTPLEAAAAEGEGGTGTGTTTTPTPPPAAPPQGPAPVPESTTTVTGLPAFPLKPGSLPPPSLPGPNLRASVAKPLISESEEDCEVEDILSPLQEALDNCRSSVRKQICDDISKRLAILQQMWTEGKLSTPVRRGMRILTQELKNQHWDIADDIHRSLIVDHVTEVSQWMVGVKRLIAETRNLPTEDCQPKVETCSDPGQLQK
ncbi:steroid receptor RNA activator 1 [Hemicordylus capensis]|uniref:steroid receptor RNA activator 1 n=1 Tax=Hemicordylus capensis TaxID=884348 RepID=UPI00230303CA|nr:steroid receptor RNA activator 1 [Hemicordylus capensis]XP_053106700.1 steroid receptor RNA activator 1 [Hemicordylus capensis]